MNFSFLFILVIITCYSCESASNESDLNTSEKSNRTENELPAPINRVMKVKPEILPDSVIIFRFNLKDTLFVDFNCDDLIDQAFFRKIGNKIKLIIRDGNTSDENLVGTDSTFQGIGDDFNWVDLWGITADSATYEVLVKDGEVYGSNNVQLQCISIVVRREEDGGGIITFKNGTYKWIHQAD